MKCPNCNSTRFFGDDKKRKCEKCGYENDKTKKCQMRIFEDVN